MNMLFIMVDLVCLFLLIGNIHGSSRRWLSVGYAILGFAIPLVLGGALVFVINSGIDTIGTAMTLACPVAAVLGANIPPRRGAAQP
jgi:hypothetical protein